MENKANSNLDSETTVGLINRILDDMYEAGNTDDGGYLLGILDAIYSVCSFSRGLD